MDKFLVRCEVTGTDAINSYIVLCETEAEAVLEAKNSLFEFETKCGIERSEFYFNIAYNTLTFEAESYDGKNEMQIAICVGPITPGEKVEFYGFKG